MAPIIQARPGTGVYDLNEPVAASQTIYKGDLVKYDASGNIIKAAIGDAPVLGVAVHDKTTGATVTALDRLVVSPFTAISRHRATLKNATALNRNLIGTTAGFIVEAGEYRIDTAATVKQAVITDVTERPFATVDPNTVFIEVPAPANRIN